MPSIKICVSSASPPRTNNRPSSATVVVPGKVCKAPTKSPKALAVVTTSSAVKADTLLLSPAENVPADKTTASNTLTSSRSLICKPFNKLTSPAMVKVSYDKKETTKVCVPVSEVVN